MSKQVNLLEGSIFGKLTRLANAHHDDCLCADGIQSGRHDLDRHSGKRSRCRCRRGRHLFMDCR